MAFFTSLMGRGVGLVEIFRNPYGREWLELQRYADPLDGIRGYLIAGDLYLWGSMPLHRDVQPLMRAEIDAKLGDWLAVQINPRLATCLLSERVRHEGTRADIDGAEAILRRSMPLARLLGKSYAIRGLGAAVGKSAPGPASEPTPEQTRNEAGPARRDAGEVMA